jgi:arsenate reductase
MDSKIRVLFICQHNSGRSQMAEALLEKLGGETFEVESAGFEPAKEVNPLVIEVMNEEGADLSNKKPQSVIDLFKVGRLFDHVITVCEGNEEKCPIFPGIVRRWNWPFPDPSVVTGSETEKLEEVRKIRDGIKEKLLSFSDEDFDLASLLTPKN